MNCENNRYQDKKQNSLIIKGYGFIHFRDLNNVYVYYLSYSLIFRIIRKVMKMLRLWFIFPLFYGKWKKYLRDTELIILFDAGLEDEAKLTSYIKKNNPSLKLVFWYWNPVTPKNNAALNNKNIDEVWTYNRFDAKKYNLKYSPQFYRQILDGRVSNGMVSDIDMIFLGKDKGRKKILQGLEKNAVAMGLKCDFTIVRKKKDKVGYEEYSYRVLGSKCIVDLVPNQECGLTLRPMEALFYKKKLITNYKDIVNYDFYDKENIFLLGKDDVNKLVEFINSPYKEIDPRIVDFYRYESWLKRIENGEDIKI